MQCRCRSPWLFHRGLSTGHTEGLEVPPPLRQHGRGLLQVSTPVASAPRWSKTPKYRHNKSKKEVDRNAFTRLC